MISKLYTWIRSAALGTVVASLVLAVMIVVGEEVPDFKNWLKATFYHHWLGKGVITLALFAVVTLVARWKGDSPKLATMIFVEIGAVVIACIIIAGFFLLHTLHLV